MQLHDVLLVSMTFALYHSPFHRIINSPTDHCTLSNCLKSGSGPKLEQAALSFMIPRLFRSVRLKSTCPIESIFCATLTQRSPRPPGPTSSPSATSSAPFSAIGSMGWYKHATIMLVTIGESWRALMSNLFSRLAVIHLSSGSGFWGSPFWCSVTNARSTF